MENKSIAEDVNETQRNIVLHMRKKYPNTISKYYEQNNKIEIKLLEKRILKPEARFEIPREFALEENLVDNLNEDLIDKEKIKKLRDRLKNLDKIMLQNIRVKNSDIYIQLAENM